MVIREGRSTLEDLWALDQLPENAGKRFELLNGEIYEVPTPEPEHNFVVGQLYGPMWNFNTTHKLGFVFGDNTSYTLSSGDELIPDVSFVAKEHAGFPLPKKFLLAPDLAIEVKSPSNTERELLDKAESYLKSGTRLVWLAYPESRVVWACRLAEDGDLKLRKVELDGTLDGEEVLPGFELAVKDIFPAG
jgi:Uma2 family endonuclease